MDRSLRQDKLSTRLNLFWIGLGMYIFGYAQPDIILHSAASRLLTYIMYVGIIFIFFGLFSTLKWSANQRTTWAKGLIIFLLFWHLFMALQREAGDLLGIPNYFDPYCYTLYLYPLVLLIPVLPLVRSFFRVSRWLMLIGVPLLSFPLLYYATYGAIQFAFEGFVVGAALILMTSRYQSRNWLIAAALILAFAFLVATITARRNLMMTTMLYMMGGAYMILFRSHKVSRSTQIFVIMSGVVLALLAVAFFMMNSSGMFAKISGRANENTRDYVFLLFFWDMLQTPFEMIIGRGIRGQYECQGVDGDISNTMRGAVENGYLQLMLKGGIIYIITYVGIFFTAICQAWHSRNQLCRAAIIILCVQLFDMLPFGLHAVNLKTFMIWMCVSICLCSSLWDLTDEEICEQLTEKNYRLPKWKE